MRNLWNRIMRRTVEREAEREQMSPAEHRYTAESVEDHQADEFIAEHLGGHHAEDEPPR